MRITLLTDFGTADGYVAAMKGAIAEISPSTLIDDASHAIPPGDIVGAALALKRYWKLYPEGTVHVVVVDPGVGSERRALAINADGRCLVGPDNGVFTFVLKTASDAKVIEIDAELVTKPSSRTFHGRDIFAPAAAQLAAGVSVDRLGRVITDPVAIPMPPPIATEASVRGEVVQIDRFGNLVSNIGAELLRPGYVARVAEREMPVVATYADAAVGELIALINSDNLVEIAVRDGSAAIVLDAQRGAAVELWKR
jgi:hypothetical protein